MESIKLTDREIEIIKLIAQEKTTKEIANILKCAKRTIEKHKSNLCGKTGSYTVIGIILYGVKTGIIKITIIEK